jgi:hypothetical protein
MIQEQWKHQYNQDIWYWREPQTILLNGYYVACTWLWGKKSQTNNTQSEDVVNTKAMYRMQSGILVQFHSGKQIMWDFHSKYLVLKHIFFIRYSKQGMNKRKTEHASVLIASAHTKMVNCGQDPRIKVHDSFLKKKLPICTMTCSLL